ncbi:MAG: GHKL domain-containing protein [Clostridia bacterium]|nr:GHKL domain-containing protein [Clostridia bacterium]
MAAKLVEIAVNIFQACLILFFMKSRLNIPRPSRIADALCIISCAAYYSACLFVKMPNDVFTMIFPLLYAVVMASDPVSVRIFWTAVLALFVTSVPGLCLHLMMAVFSVQMEDLMLPGLLRYVAMFATNAVLFLVIYSVSKLRKSRMYLSWPVLITFLAVSASILVTEECLYTLQLESVGETTTYIVGNASLLLCSYLMVCLFHFFSESSERESQYREEANMLAALHRHQQEFGRMYDDFLSRQHDFKHQLETIQGLIAKNNAEEAKQYLEKYHLQLSENQLFMTGCTAMDALLTIKHLTMKSKGFRFKYSPYPLSVIPISVQDLCAVVGNLLDNAIEGAERVCSPASPIVISLAFSRTYDMFHVVCENPYNPTCVEHDRGRWLSSKREDRAGFHGRGIPNIRKIVDQAEGYASFEANNMVFRAELSIPFPKDGDGVA